MLILLDDVDNVCTMRELALVSLRIHDNQQSTPYQEISLQLITPLTRYKCLIKQDTTSTTYQHLHILSDYFTVMFIFVTTGGQKLVKIQISNKKMVKSIGIEEVVFGMDIYDNIYRCEYSNKSVIVFDKKLNFLKHIPLKSPHIIIFSIILS